MISNGHEALVYLHGFLGSPKEATPLLEELCPLTSYVPELFEPGPLSPEHDFASWTTNFTYQLPQSVQKAPRRVLIGYSQGGRLALHAAARSPEMWDEVILVSTNPGILSAQAKKERRQWEAKWQHKLKSLTWTEFLKEWNAQDIFAHSPPRNDPPPGDPELLALALHNWSLTCHSFSWQALPSSLLWCVGEYDYKLRREYEKLRELPGRCVVLPQAGHRIPQQAPQTLAQLLRAPRAF